MVNPTTADSATAHSATAHPESAHPAAPPPPPDVVAQLTAFPTASGPLELVLRVGDVIVLRGRNGSGKTSLLRALAGLPAIITPKEASLTGENPTGMPAYRLRDAVHFATQEPRDGLAGLTVQGEFGLRDLVPPSEIHHLGERDVATLSSGESRRVALALAGARQVPLLLLDEPMEGLDERGRTSLLDLVARCAATGAVVAADHSDALEELATRIIDLDPVDERPLQPIANPTGASVLSSPAVTRQRGSLTLQLPNLELGPGLHVVTGVNGSGKSTLLLYLAGLLGPHSVRLRGVAHETGSSVRLLLPRATDLWSKESVAAELLGADDEVVAQLVPMALLPRHPLTLSAGEGQRVALAKTLGRFAPTYLLDEPEAHLDASGREALRDIVAARVASGACVIAASHDPTFRALTTSHVAMALPVQP